MNPGKISLVLVGICWAVGIWTSAHARPGGATDSLYRAGVQLYVEGQYTKAIEVLQRVCADTLSAPAAFYLGAASAANNDFKTARLYLQKAVELVPDITAYRFQLARFLSQAGLVREAELQYSNIIKVDSSFAPALSSLGLLAFERGDFKRSLDLFSRVVRQNPRDFAAYYHIGNGLFNLEQPDSARAFLSTCLALNPNYVPAINLLAILYYRKPDYHEALRLLEHLQEVHPENADYAYRSGLCNEKLGNGTEAVSSFCRATTLDSLNEFYFAHLGQAYFTMQHYDSCIVAYQRATTIDSENPLFFVNMALAWERCDSTQRAADSFRRSVVAYHPEVIARVYNHLGALYYNRKHYREAKDAYRKALSWNSGDLNAQFYLAVSYDKIRNRQPAIDTYHGFLKASGGNDSLKEQVAWATKRLRELTKKP